MALDFLVISTRKRKGVTELYPTFKIDKANDLMTRGGDFYAIWDQNKNLWSTDEYDAIRLVDQELEAAAGELNYPDLFVSYMWNSDTGSIDRWHKYVQKQRPERFHELDTHVIFANEKITKRDYATKFLPYAIEEGKPEHFHQLFDILYEPEELTKLQWAIGAIMLGEAWKYQKFMVLVGPGGTGKSTFLNLVDELLEGYTAPFIAKDLVGGGAFPLEAFANNPLVAIQHDGDLSRIEDNSVLNSLVSGEEMMVNEKYKKMYKMRFHTFLMLGTNKPVKITDAKSGLIRRLIDVIPTGNTVPRSEYLMHTKALKFELGKIANECINVYKEDPDRYVGYVPTNMLSATNDFYNFITDKYYELKDKVGISLADSWEKYKEYCKDANVLYPYSRRVFAEELKNYYEEFYDRFTLDDGTRVRSYYNKFKADIFQTKKKSKKNPPKLILDRSMSELDIFCENCPAQYSTEEGIPSTSWSKCKTQLKELDTHKEHWLKVPKNMIVIDFDIQDENGEKDREKNLIAAAEWPTTYAEFSKSGKGVHLHYIYNGDISKLQREYAEHVEIKTFPGNSSLRRKLTLCNGAKIAEITGGLPLKEEESVNVVKEEKIRSVQSLRRLIERNLRKEIHPGTKPSVEFIKTILDQCYESDLEYDISDMRNSVLAFAASSTHHPDYCIGLVAQMKFKSDPEMFENEDAGNADPFIFFDCEVFPNLFIVCWKFEGENQPIHRMINPQPDELESVFKHRAIGFNNRRYDNHVCYARIMGYKLEQIYELSQKIILKNDGFFSEAFNLSYTDIYDFCSKKQSLKKWEFELGIHHQELGLPWDQPVDQGLWDMVAAYCDNDVMATEAVFNARQSDFVAREILADLAGMTVNDTTNSLTTRIIFGKDRHPQHVYTNLATGEQFTSKFNFTIDATGLGLPETIVRNGIVQNFPGYEYAEEFVNKPDGTRTLIRHNYFRGVDLGLGGYVYAEPGVYDHVAVIDIQSLHPSSLIAMNCFGEYTQNFADLVQARIDIKHSEYDKAGELFDGRLKPYLTDEKSAGALSNALKIAINSVYGLTSASFQNPMKDDRNINNIVALRGALFMKTLQDEVVKKGFQVVHIKTDSIKIPNATKEIIDFCIDFAAKYGYSFDHESTYQKMCLVNGSTYICRYDSNEWCMNHYGYLPSKQKEGKWSATALQFQVPYVFKTLFSKEEITFDDLCEVKSVTGDSALYLDMDEGLPEGEHRYLFVGRVGQFTPIKPGHGGGILYRYKDDKYYAATGTKGYRWLESEDFRSGKFTFEDIDISYYEAQVEEAKKAIGVYCDADIFCSDNEIDIGFMNPPRSEEEPKEFN